MGAAARAYVADRFSLERVAEMETALLEELARGRSDGRDVDAWNRITVGPSGEGAGDDVEEGIRRMAVAHACLRR